MKCPICHSENSDTARFCSNCAAPLTSPDEARPPVTQTIETSRQELTTGSTFAGRYQIIEELGAGGMGKIYKALDKETQEKTALKLINPEIASDEKTIRRFRNELITARKISHKNVCRMYDLGREQGGYYIAMEYVSGEDLKSFIRRSGILSVGRTISIAKQVCEGLQEAHRMKVIHRDLKSNNIMIDRDGNVRIMDFGIARSLTAKGITGPGVMIGTPEYMSPEQVEGKDVDQRSDIYSLGIILYEMVTGRVPFEGDTAIAIGMKHKGEIPKSPQELNTQIPDDLNRVILRCMEKDKEKRYQSSDDVRCELERIEQGLPTTDRVVSRKKPLTSREITVQFKLKKLFIPVSAVVAAVAVGLILWGPWTKKREAPIPGDRSSIAVLPFYDLSPQKNQEYFCDGLAAELINRLNKIENLRVPAQASSFSFKSKNLDVQEIGKKLNVESVLAGSLQKSENRIRITVELVNVSDGFPIWSEKYERDMEEIFALQDEISLSIVDNLRITLLGEEKAEFVTRHTRNSEAYNFFLRGIYFWEKRTPSDIRKAIDYFGQAIKLDPDYALAYARLADSYSLLPFYTSVLPEEAFVKAKSAVKRALDINDTLAEAHSALGFIKMYSDWDWEAAETELKRAVQSKTDYVTAHHWYAEYLSWTGRHEEAIAEISRAYEIDPLSLLINYIKAYILFYARHYERAIEQCRKTLELDSDFHLPYRTLGRVYLEKGMYEEAITAYQKSGNRHGLGIAYAQAGQKDKALEILGEMKEEWKRGAVRALPMARIYIGLGDSDQALDWLEKSLERREPRMVLLKVDPRFDSLRSNPRFKALLKKMNLE
ncbi:MAG: protein kinase [Deltaproteobacteria bacterium]|nr:protein kinase [Deltaproteobacteria bacterium]